MSPLVVILCHSSGNKCPSCLLQFNTEVLWLHTAYSRSSYAWDNRKDGSQ